MHALIKMEKTRYNGQIQEHSLSLTKIHDHSLHLTKFHEICYFLLLCAFLDNSGQLGGKKGDMLSKFEYLKI